MSDPTEVLAHPTPPLMPAAAGKTVFDALTVRDLLAGFALQGVLAAHGGEVSLPIAKQAAKWAREYADALLIELNHAPYA